jgi:hypothetical protein
MKLLFLIIVRLHLIMIMQRLTITSVLFLPNCANLIKPLSTIINRST